MWLSRARRDPNEDRSYGTQLNGVPWGQDSAWHVPQSLQVFILAASERIVSLLHGGGADRNFWFFSPFCFDL